MTCLEMNPMEAFEEPLNSNSRPIRYAAVPRAVVGRSDSFRSRTVF